MTQNSITFGGVAIPGPQAQPPAGHDDIAFRPACTQLVSVYQANGLNAFTVPLPDGTIRTLAELPQMSPGQAHAWLDSSGLCKVGGIDVPILFTDQLPQQQTARVSASVMEGTPVPDGVPIAAIASEGGGVPLLPLSLGLVVLVGAGVAVWGFRSGLFAGWFLPVAVAQNKRTSPHPQPPPVNDAEPTAGADDLIDELWG
ncbi:MAG: hypothetical protein O3A14_19390 [Cyanobacteria bacterium]|nr:hypothetical protein [Cyanobacteriota bacterium]